MVWNYLFIPKQLHRWCLCMDKYFHTTVNQACDYLSMPGFKLNHVSICFISIPQIYNKKAWITRHIFVIFMKHCLIFWATMYLLSLGDLIKIFPKRLLLQIYKSNIQSKLDSGLSISGYTTEDNLDLVQRIQNCCARIINYDDCITLTPEGYTLLSRWNFSSIANFKTIFCVRTMVVEIHGYNASTSKRLIPIKMYKGTLQM